MLRVEDRREDRSVLLLLFVAVVVIVVLLKLAEEDDELLLPNKLNFRCRNGTDWLGLLLVLFVALFVGVSGFF